MDAVLENSCPNNRRFIKMPLCYQETAFTCGVACVQSLFASYGIIYRQDALVKLLKQQPYFGTDYHDIINITEMLGFNASLHTNLKISDLKEYIDADITPILMMQAWKDDEIPYEYDWKDSHYQIACGYEYDRMIFMDPYTLGNYVYISEVELKQRWHAVDSLGTHHHAAALIIYSEDLDMIYRPNIIIHQG